MKYPSLSPPPPPPHTPCLRRVARLPVFVGCLSLFFSLPFPKQNAETTRHARNLAVLSTFVTSPHMYPRLSLLVQGMPTAAKRHDDGDDRSGRSREGYNYKYGLSSSSSASRVEAARAAAEAEAAEPYMPLMPAWKQVARGADREHLRNLKLELTTVEDQVSSSRGAVRRGWRRGEVQSPVSQAPLQQDAAGVCRPACSCFDVFFFFLVHSLLAFSSGLCQLNALGVYCVCLFYAFVCASR